MEQGNVADDAPQAAAVPEAWLASVQKQLEARGLQGRAVRYALLTPAGDERPATWAEVASWLGESARLGAWRYGFAVHDDPPDAASVVFVRSRHAAAPRADPLGAPESR